MPYHKICIACTKGFIARRISAIFCSDKCRNQGRSMSSELKTSLVKRNSQYVMEANNWVATVPTVDGSVSAIGYNPVGATENNPLGNEEDILFAKARNMARERGLKVKTSYDYAVEKQEEEERLKSLSSPSGFNVVDESSISPDIPCDAVKNDNDDLSNDIKPTTASDNTPTVTPKKYNIKPIQHRNGDK